MTTDDVIKLHQHLCSTAQQIMRNKQDDYTNGTSNPFRNFELGPHLGVGTVSQGLFTRFLDKVSRLATFMSRGKFTVNESVEDTILDGINYLVLLYASVILEERKKSPHDAHQIEQVLSRPDLDTRNADGHLCLSGGRNCHDPHRGRTKRSDFDAPAGDGE